MGKVAEARKGQERGNTRSELVTGVYVQVREEIEIAFQQGRAFPFYPRDEILQAMRNRGADYSAGIEELATSVLHEIAEGDNNAEFRLTHDARLFARISRGIEYIHRIIAESDSAGESAEGLDSLSHRRFVLIRERRGAPTLYYTPELSSVTHIGLGPTWLESPSIYCGLGLMDLIADQLDGGVAEGYANFSSLLSIEGQALDEGISYSPELIYQKSALTSYFIRALENRSVDLLSPDTRVSKAAAPRKLEQSQVTRYYRLLDARSSEGSLDFDTAVVIDTVKKLEKRARDYRRAGDRDSLRKITELLVAASGHDIHEARNRANLALERIFSPKEYNAPPATDFINIRRGEKHRFEFSLPRTEGLYVLRVYRQYAGQGLMVDDEIQSTDIAMRRDPESEQYIADFEAEETGSYDFLVTRVGKKTENWVTQKGCSGRINVLPDVRGEIVLQIFTDIHGHTRAYWQKGDGHPGLVYNEHGQVIRLGRFSDITAHLDDLASRFGITTLYLLGVFERGRNKEDWAPGATSPSPFSPMSFRKLEPSLGGEEEFVELISEAHARNIKIIVDLMPHLNRTSEEVPEEWKVRCYDAYGDLVVRASTDGRYGSWDDGMLLNYREFDVWSWLGDSVEFLIGMGVDGIRFDTAHSVPIMMKKNNFPLVYEKERSHEEMVKGGIVVNDREHDHLITTGYYDSACRDLIACPLQTYLVQRIHAAAARVGKSGFLYIAECYWGRERYLARSGIFPYNMALFKICESILHGLSDVREIYHLYHDYFPQALPRGTEMLGILGNHDERRALNTFGKRGARAAIGLTCFLSTAVLDYEGSAEGESWKVFPDNIYVDWNKFEQASDRSIESFYREVYAWHRGHPGTGYLTWAENNQVASALRFCADGIWVGVFNFSEANQYAKIHFDRSELPIDDDGLYRLVDPLYSSVTGTYVHYTGRELRTETIDTVVSYTDRVKLLKLERMEPSPETRTKTLRDSLLRLHRLKDGNAFLANYAFLEGAERFGSYEEIRSLLIQDVLPQFPAGVDIQGVVSMGIKRSLYYLQKFGYVDGAKATEFMNKLAGENDTGLSTLGSLLLEHNKKGPSVFISAEAEPFSKSGGLANVVFELPRELVRFGEDVHVITPRYRHGTEQAVARMQKACQKYKAAYTGQNVSFYIEGVRYDVGVHVCKVEGITYYLLDHFEFFDGLYYGYTSKERLRKRIALARASAEVMIQFDLQPSFVFTNDAFAGVFNGIVRADPHYAQHPGFQKTSFFHVIHNGGWQYFDAYSRYEGEKDLFPLFGVDQQYAGDFADPDNFYSINCMATGIRFADKSITVSPSYAEQLKVASDGLERVVGDVVGISNAIGSDFAKRAVTHVKESGQIDQLYKKLIEIVSDDEARRLSIEDRYPEVLEGVDGYRSVKSAKRRDTLERIRNKLLVQVAYGLDVDPEVKLAVMVHRVADQKGYQLLLEASEGVLKNLRYQIIAGGPVIGGDQQSEALGRGLETLDYYYPGQAAVRLGFLDVRLLLLGADLFLMPSRHEPGGISQMEALACGCLVLARATGGLRDTIQPLLVKGKKITGNGILFTDYSSDSFYDGMRRYAAFYDNADDELKYQARRNARKSARYWDTPARQYLELMYDHKEIIRS